MEQAELSGTRGCGSRRADPPRGSRQRPLRASRARAVAALAFLVVLASPGCAREERSPIVMDGDPKQGRVLLRQYGCHTCHAVPGVRGANALVGPPLDHWSQRAWVAGLVPNTPDNVVAFIVDPTQIHPQTAMPMLAVSPDEARHMAAYLFTLK